MILLPAILVILLIRFWYMPFIFFIQDEWYVFGTFIASGPAAVFSGYNLSRLGHFVPLSKFISYLIYSIFGLNSLPFNLVAITVHLLNAALIFKISKKMIKDRFWQVFPALIFLSSFIGFEQVNWPMVGINALSLSFVLLAWLLSFGELKPRKIFLIVVLLILSVFILESTLPAFVFICGLILFKSKKGLIWGIKAVSPILLVLIFYLVFRGYALTGSSNYSRRNTAFITRIVTLPFEYLSQSFIPQPITLGFSEKISTTILPKNDDYSQFSEQKAFPAINLIFGLIVFSLVVFVSKRCREFLIPLAFIILSSFPFLFVPGDAGNFSIFPPRYMYSGLAGSSLILGMIGYYFFSKAKLPAKIWAGFLILIIMLGLYYNFETNQRFYKEGLARKEILNLIKDKYPHLPSRVVFYTESDRPYYGLPDGEQILPFQSGFGQTLLVWYWDTERFPKEFFSDRFLWEIESQGYREIDGMGFGYFRDFDKLKNTLKAYKLSDDSVISFSWNSKLGESTDISGEIKDRLNSSLR